MKCIPRYTKLMFSYFITKIKITTKLHIPTETVKIQNRNDTNFQPYVFLDQVLNLIP